MSKNSNAARRRRAGNTGEAAACAYLVRRGFVIVGRNIARKTGELDIVAKGPRGMHVVEVKTARCQEFPRQAGPGTHRPGGEEGSSAEGYDPGMNLHAHKIRKVARTAEWYLADVGWEGEWQLDGALVWLRERDGRCLVRYMPQIL